MSYWYLQTNSLYVLVFSNEMGTWSQKLVHKNSIQHSLNESSIILVYPYISNWAEFCPFEFKVDQFDLFTSTYLFCIFGVWKKFAPYEFYRVSQKKVWCRKLQYFTNGAIYQCSNYFETYCLQLSSRCV